MPEITQASVEIFGGCNYRCPMCPQSGGREREFLATMPLASFSSIMQQLSELGCKSVSLQGSGEPLMVKNIFAYIKEAEKFGIQCSMVTNGYKLDESFAEQLCDSNFGHLRISVIGYDVETYAKWMSKDAFELVQKNSEVMLNTLAKRNSKIAFSSYHLILDQEKLEWELEQYQNNWITPLGIKAEVWKMHNWSGEYQPPYQREASSKRTCGRPFAPYLNVRAGGLNGKHAAVVPCCYVLGKDSTAVLGHLSEQSIAEVWNGEPYQKLREAHQAEDFDSISYCKDCDQLLQAPDSLVWTNISGKKYGQFKYDDGLDFIEIGKASN